MYRSQSEKKNFVVLFQVKSMAEHLARSDKLNAPRKMRFPKQFSEDVASLVSMMTRDIVDRYNRVRTNLKLMSTISVISSKIFSSIVFSCDIFH